MESAILKNIQYPLISHRSDFFVVGRGISFQPIKIRYINPIIQQIFLHKKNQTF